MNPEEIQFNFSADNDKPVLEIEGTRFATLPALMLAVPELKQPEHLSRYCAALNHLAYGLEYRVITDSDAYRARYEAKYQAEDPEAPFEEGITRLHDFGYCDTSEIQAPRLDGGSVVFYVEDDFLSIPYRVTGPGPGEAEGDVQYEPLPMQPNKA